MFMQCCMENLNHRDDFNDELETILLTCSIVSSETTDDMGHFSDNIDWDLNIKLEIPEYNTR